MKFTSSALLFVAASLLPTKARSTELTGRTIQVWNTTGDANQGVGVDENYIYAVTNRRITKMDKRTGELLMQWDGEEDFPTGHFDSGAVVDNKLYVAQGNWPLWPMASTVEIFDTETMEHIGTHSFGIQIGSFTWMDYYDFHWWGTFASYDRYQTGAMESYGKGYNVQMVKMDEDFNILQRWQIPDEIRKKFEIMSNSGGSWGPDGFLYLTGHDLPEVYVMEIPIIGSVLHHVATIPVPDIEGQGIAWDHSEKHPTLYGIYRPNKQVIVTRMPTKDRILKVGKMQSDGVVHTDVKDFST